MNRIGTPSLEQMSYVASICGKYCSKITALTNELIMDEIACCKGCLHWNEEHCSKFNSVLFREEQEGYA